MGIFTRNEIERKVIYEYIYKNMSKTDVGGEKVASNESAGYQFLRPEYKHLSKRASEYAWCEVGINYKGEEI